MQCTEQPTDTQAERGVLLGSETIRQAGIDAGQRGPHDEALPSVQVTGTTQILDCVQLHGAPQVPTAVQLDCLRPSIRSGGCHWSWVQTTDGHNLLHAEWQEAGRRGTWAETTQLLSYCWSERAMQRSREFWTDGLCLH